VFPILRLLPARSFHACGVFIERTSINEELEKMRLSTTSSYSGRRDILVVASVSCLYGIGVHLIKKRNCVRERSNYF
jgi:excinuclease UvrABC helicase subunit UvrB